MSPADRPADLTADRQRLWAALAAQPHAHDLLALLRRIQALHPELPRLGQALRPRDEPLRLGQDAELDFAPATVHSVTLGAGAPRIGQRALGLFGPMGALPLHLTEYARSRAQHAGDPTLARFADVFHHRALLLFFRAWAQARPEVHHDRPADDAHARWLASLYGQGGSAFVQRSRVADNAKRLHAGWLARGPRSAEGLAKFVGHYLGLPVRVQPCAGHWLALDAADRSRLGRAHAGLGGGATLGSRVWDRQSHTRLHIGPLALPEWLRLLPGQPTRLALRDAVHEILGLAVAVDARVTLRGSAVPRLHLGRQRPHGRLGRLGQTAWLGRRQPHPDSAALHLRLT
ncbi:MAG: type VI secretion system baseplate subunit TssG [Proteobacteria bacterium]|nr:type VI secretion system baseplate subunit TssG [Pseudomonadota bacterium]